MPLLSSLVSGLAVATLASEKAVPLSSHTTCGIFGLPFPTWIPLLSGPCASPRPTGLQTQTCFIHVKDTTGKDYGYLKSERSDLGMYNEFSPTTEDALKVSFEYDPSAPSGFSMKAVNNPASQAGFPFLGGATCGSDLNGHIGDDPEKYGCLVGTTETLHGSTPVSGENSVSHEIPAEYMMSESAIWNYDSVTQELTTQWINPDETIVATQIVFADDFAGDPLVLTDDPEALNEKNEANYPEMTFTCEPTTS